MARVYQSTSQFRYGPRFDSGFLQEEVKNEPMFFNSDLVFAKMRGGNITNTFINEFLFDNPGIAPKDCVFDSRVHMLMPGWFPCIPGFHHDDVPRNTADGQPDYSATRAYFSQHCMGMVNGDICPTQFATGHSFLPFPEQDIIYKHWHPIIEGMVEQGTMQVTDAESGRLLYFDADTLHQGQRARASGWRWFGRISWNTDRVKHVTNELRRQVQVYLEYPMEGW